MLVCLIVSWSWELPALVWIGKYFAAASMYMGGCAKINAGPSFRYPPDDFSESLVKPLCEVPPEPAPVPPPVPVRNTAADS